MAHDGFFDFGRALHEEGEGDEDEGDEDHDPDDVDVGEEAGLALGHAVDLSPGMVHGVGGGHAAVLEGAGEAGAHLFEGAVAGRGMGAEHVEVALGEAGEHGGHEADADAAAEIS